MATSTHFVHVLPSTRLSASSFMLLAPPGLVTDATATSSPAASYSFTSESEKAPGAAVFSLAPGATLRPPVKAKTYLSAAGGASGNVGGAGGDGGDGGGDRAAATAAPPAAPAAAPR